MNRREFLKYLGVSAPYQHRLLSQLVAAQASLLLAPLFPWRAAACASDKLVEVVDLKHWSTPDYTRISVELEKEVRFESHKLPSRLYFDIPGAHVSTVVKDLNIGDGLLKSVRIAQYRPSTVRVVLDLDSIKDYKIFTFADPFRIIVDVKGERRQEISSGKKEVIETSKPEPKQADQEKVTEKAKPAEKSKQPFKPGKIRRIVVDPGHGGHDPGAMSPSGTREKDIVLQIGLKLSQKIREELGIDVVMTRSTDVFIELQERTAIANKVGGDLFVSIHANASLNHAANGIETYYLNLAKTEKVAQLAAKENGTTLEKVNVLQAVLFDLMANSKLNDSAHLADEVQKALHKKAQTGYPSVKNLGVKQGPFYVLVGATMPSILVETAFVSNERDEQKLKDPAYQDLTAEGILSGIKGYIASLK
jgi:N-acetylmuramoyl-L-alanine amidase